MEQKINALKLNQKDNIAVALENLNPGEHLKIQDYDEDIEIVNHIPYGHKIALQTIPKDGKVIKYGECMGITTKDIPVGSHVHVSNVRGLTEQDKAKVFSERGLVNHENI